MDKNLLTLDEENVYKDKLYSGGGIGDISLNTIAGNAVASAIGYTLELDGKGGYMMYGLSESKENTIIVRAGCGEGPYNDVLPQEAVQYEPGFDWSVPRE